MRLSLHCLVLTTLLTPCILCAQETAATDTLSEVVVYADKISVNTTQTGLISLDGNRLNSGFALFSSPDVIKVLQNLPGVAPGTELLSGLYVRGGDGTDNIFLLDGVPLYQVTHIGGLFSSFNSDIISNLDFYKSGFPARYGGRLSSVSDVRTKEGDYNGYGGMFSIGLLCGRIQFEGPIVKGKSSFNVAMRHSWLELLTIPGFAIYNANRTDKTSLQYRFYDINANLSFRPDDVNTLSVSFFKGKDVFAGNEMIEEKYYGSKIYVGQDTSDTGIEWGNLSGSLDWRHKYESWLSSSFKAYYTVSSSDIGQNVNDWTVEKATEFVNTAATEETNGTVISDIGLSVDFSCSNLYRQQIRFGAIATYHRYNPHRSVSVKDWGDTRSYEYVKLYKGIETGLYAEDEFSIGSLLKVNTGARFAMYHISGKTFHSLEPRIALKYQISSNVSVKLSYSEMTQFSHLVASTYLDLPTNIWMPSTDKIQPSESKQIAAGAYACLPNNFHLSVEVWHKTMDNLLYYSGQTGLFPSVEKWEESFVNGSGKAYGAELDFGYRTDKIDASLYYTLSWNKRMFKDIYPDWFYDRNDNRHKLTLSGTLKLSKVFDAYATWNIHSGGWMTIPEQVLLKDNQYTSERFPQLENLYYAPNNLKMPVYHRLDIGCNFRKSTKKGYERIWNVSIYNAYCKLNPIFIQLEQVDDGRYVGKGIAIIPIIPSVSYTLKF